MRAAGNTAARRVPALLYLLLAILQPPSALVPDYAAPASRAAAMSAASKRGAGLMAFNKRNAKKEKAIDPRVSIHTRSAQQKGQTTKRGRGRPRKPKARAYKGSREVDCMDQDLVMTDSPAAPRSESIGFDRLG